MGGVVGLWEPHGAVPSAVPTAGAAAGAGVAAEPMLPIRMAMLDFGFETLSKVSLDPEPTVAAPGAAAFDSAGA